MLTTTTMKAKVKVTLLEATSVASDDEGRACAPCVRELGHAACCCHQESELGLCDLQRLCAIHGVLDKGFGWLGKQAEGRHSEGNDMCD
jgi:hypothetical protein